MRYVGRIGARQSSAGSVTYGLRTYVSQGTTSTLDCFAAYHMYVSQVRWRLRKDGQGVALPCPGALRRDGGRGLRRDDGRGLRTRTARGTTPSRLRRATPPERGIYGEGFR
ncbi:MAG: hypothetical protein LBM98_11490 [Oscillospiraceae bacterium]|nr:hypothetical protein [Oscillospiraceae bacterium]